MGENLSFGGQVLSGLGEWVSNYLEWVDPCMYKERPVGQQVDQLANNVLCGWVITDSVGQIKDWCQVVTTAVIKQNRKLPSGLMSLGFSNGGSHFRRKVK